MASKLSTTPSGPTEHAVHNSLSFSNRLLASQIPLPPNPTIVYAAYHPVPTSSPSTPTAFTDDAAETARRLLFRKNSSAGTAILDSILPVIRTGDDQAGRGDGGRCLHVFLVTAEERFQEAKDRLEGLQLEGLSGE